MKARTVALNQLHGLLVTADDALRTKLCSAFRAEMLATYAAFRIRSDDDSVSAMTRFTLRELVQRAQHLDEQVDRCVQRISRITAALAPKLLQLKGIDLDVASTLLITVDDNPDRMHHEKSFTNLCETSPLQASSGKTTRHHRHRQPRAGHAARLADRMAAVPLPATDPPRRATSTRGVPVK